MSIKSFFQAKAASFESIVADVEQKVKVLLSHAEAKRAEAGVLYDTIAAAKVTRQAALDEADKASAYAAQFTPTTPKE